MSAIYMVKSEPSVYSFERFQKEKKAVWDGVRNYEARNNLREMKKGDLVLFYHSNEGKEIVGIGKVTREAFQDPTTEEDFSAVELAPVKALAEPVTLATLKAHPRLKEMALVKKSRISVTKVTAKELAEILVLAKTKL
jgi:predicted RNA-binding protein with PUA-like domain